MPISRKEEVELKRYLKLCGGDWETLARKLFDYHPAVIAERIKDRQRLARAFAPSSIPRLGRKTNYKLDDILDVLDRLSALQYNRHGKLRYSSRKSALREGLGMSGSKLARWDKILSSLRLQPWPWKSTANSPFIVTPQDAAHLTHDKNCTGCIDCQGVD